MRVGKASRRERARCKSIRQTVRDFTVGMFVFLGIFTLAATEAPSLEPGTVSATATVTSNFGTVGLMALFFATMSALTLGLWRHLGRSYASRWRTGRGL